MSALTLHDFKFIRDKFPQIQLPDSWGITTSKSEDVIWNIVLAYLNSFPLCDENELTERWKRLTGQEIIHDSYMKPSAELCNPFLHRDACFNDIHMSNLVESFKKRVEYLIENDEKRFHDEPKNFRYLQASSKLLLCNIVLISSVQYQKQILVNVFPVQSPSNQQTFYTKNISILNELIFTNKIENPQEKFSFGIPKEIGIQKQRCALREILQETRVFKDKKIPIEKISGLPDITENFLISLIKSDFREIIPFIYESPDILLKLYEAGFETDPKAKDSGGKSAFFHVLKTEESELVFLLYDHAVNKCLQTDASVLSPDPVIFENLMCLKDHLKLLEKDLLSEKVSKETICLHRDLSQFNEFQMDICKSVIGIQRRLSYSDYTEEECEVLQKKETILAILKTYEKYFDSINGETSIEEDDFSHFKEFCEHKEFFDQLDLSSYVMFMDNLCFLKERLMLPSDAYLHVKTAFFLFISCKKYVKRHEKSNLFTSLCIIFQERMSLQRQIRSFIKILEKSELSKDTTVKKLPETVVYNFENLPELYGEFIIHRLLRYLNAAIRAKFNCGKTVEPLKTTTKFSSTPFEETKLNSNDLKSILVIERCLQILSECCNKTNYPFQEIISLAFPEYLIQNLEKIHNHISHMKSSEFLYRNNLEENVKLFIEIQSELSGLRKSLFRIYSAHVYERDHFLVSHLLKAFGEARRKCSLNEKENQLSKQESINQILWKSFIYDMHTFLMKEVSHMIPKRYLLYKDSGYKYIVQNVISVVGELLIGLKLTDSKKAIEYLDSYFLCLECILIYLVIFKQLKKFSTLLMSLLGRRNSIFEELRMQFRANKLINATTDRTPVEESKIYEKHSAPKPKDIRTYNQKKVKTIFRFPESCDLDKNDSRRSTFSISTIDLSENTEIHQKEIRTDSPFIEQISTTSCGDILQANVYPCPSVTSKVNCPSERSRVKNITLSEVATCLDDYQTLTWSLFQEFKANSHEYSYFKNIKSYCLVFERKTFSNNKGKKFSGLNIQIYLQNLLELKKNTVSQQRKEAEFNKKSEDSQPNWNFPEVTKKRQNNEQQMDYKFSGLSRTTDDSPLNIKSMMQSKDIAKDDNNKHNKDEMFDESKLIHPKLVLGQNEKVSNNRFEFFRSRIKLLKHILVDNSIQKFWNNATTPQRKVYVREKIVQLYLNDSEIQASVEMLLFQFKTILRSKELEKLWEKTSSVFNAINMRNFLVNDHLRLDTLGRLLNPYELVEKMLDLISDEDVVDCMQQILEQSGGTFSDFMRIMNDDEKEDFQNLRDQIQQCLHWKQYALLIPFQKPQSAHLFSPPKSKVLQADFSPPFPKKEKMAKDTTQYGPSTGFPSSPTKHLLPIKQKGKEWERRRTTIKATEGNRKSS
ncbi:unnamed protein product [Larinioides sclopetarius]|uniref:Uncharacterized protein n=1 Tax=Larinioides sclopetarius TaxID=280406 RepID=A0AAV2A7H4_9ARAC